MNTDTIKAPEKKIRNSLMEALVIKAPKEVELQKIKVPEPAKGEVRIKMQGCGLCASNLPVWEGRDWFEYPITPGNPGHEGWGVVDKVGEGVEDFFPGDRVTAITYNAFAEYDIAKSENLVRLPASLNDVPFPGEPLGCALNIFSRSDIKEGQTVAIIGIGFLGSLLVQLAHKAGARVIAVSRKESSLKSAKKFGADEVIKMDDHWQIIEKVKNLTEGNFCERVVEATGKQWPLDIAGELTATRGKLIVAGFHQDGPRQINMQLWNWKGIDVINAHERDPEEYLKGMRNAVEAVMDGRLDPRPLFTHIFPAEDLQRAFEVHKESPEGFVKALITFDYQ